MNSRAAEFRRELEDFEGIPPAWRPNVGDILIGRLCTYEWGYTRNPRRSEPCPIAIIETEQGKRLSVWLLHEVLLDEFKKQRPRPGEKIGIKRLPDHERYRRFALRIDRPAENNPAPSREKLSPNNESVEAFQDVESDDIPPWS